MKRFGSQENILGKFVTTDFEKRMLKASFLNLQNLANELCFNNFAASIRELSRHILARLSPDANVLRSVWYKNEIQGKVNGITRAQRVKYAVQGGITDDFVKNELDIDVGRLNKRITKAIDLLNKFTHVNESTLGMPPRKVYDMVNETVDAFEVLFEIVETCRRRIIRTIARTIDDSLLNHSVESTFDDIDILSTHTSVDECHISDISITGITDQDIFLTVNGMIRVRLQYGSDGDVSDGDGVVTHDSFPFTLGLTGEVNQLDKFIPEINTMKIDTSSFYE